MRRLFLALGAVSLLACGDSTGPRDSPAGTWELVSINGDRLPYTIEDDGFYRLEIMSDRIFIHSNGTFDETQIFRESEGSTVATTEIDYEGTWDHDNGSVTLFYSDGDSFTASYDGDRIIVRDFGIVAVFERD